ncbi:MAG: glycosyltransferase [Methylococcaceae bacterium]|nr:glycosyltransferase [Methylococcaceae bacterium]
MPVANNKEIIVVLGMHRSGTSTLSRGLQVMGVELGDRLMQPDQEVNAKGFWEDIDLNALNIEMLHALGSDWHHLMPIDAVGVETLCKNGYLLRAVELLRQKVGDAPIFGFKDPRVAKLLPFWKEVFSHCRFDAHYVLAVRHPLSVVRSLEKRNGLDAVKSYVLWLEHVIASVTGTVGSKRVFVDYDLLMRSAEHELGRIANQLDLSIDLAALESYKVEFLDEGLRHSVYDLSELLLDKACPSLVQDVYETLLGVASEIVEDDLLLRSKAELWAREFERIIPILGLVDGLTEQNTGLSRNVTVCDDQIADLNKLVSDLNKLVSDRDELISHMTTSHSWKITSPLRDMRRRLSDPLPKTKRFLWKALKLGKTMYLQLPLSAHTRLFLRLLVGRHSPWLLRLSSDQFISMPFSQASLVTVSPISDLRAEACGVRLATSLQPLVSVIIPIYGQCEYTLRCLLSIAENPPTVPYEVIIIDDCSPDNSLEILQMVSNIQLIHNPLNQGFIRSCNTGAKAANGQYVCFLNNDTQVTTGWLDELVRTFDEFPGTGIAGSKLVYPNGTLQEAGGIIWRDGSAWNFGRNQDPLLPVYNYAREVDYCSGASIMVPMKLFEELEGFDEHYLPAYCEDADLALKIRELGYRVIYQPLSVVVHFEGVTSGTDTTRGVKAYQVENMKKLYQRWEKRLKTHQANGVGVDDAKDRRAIYRVLVLDHCTPTPNQDSGSIDTYNFLLLLREMNFQSTFIPEDNFLRMTDYTAALQRLGVETLYAPYTTSVRQHLEVFGSRYDLVILIRPGVAMKHMSTVREFCAKAKILFHTVDLHFLRMMREAEISSSQKQTRAAEKMKSMELSLMGLADMTTVVSQKELELISLELPEHKIRLLPFARSIRGTKEGFKSRHGIVFVGGYQHTPNVDAVKYFTAEIMPIIRSRLPGVHLHIVGSNPPPEILALAAADVVIVGFVEELNPLLDRMRVSVAPLRFGAGIKGKIGTAMAVGLPVVATTIAAEGMLLTDGEHVLVADQPEDFAEALIRLYQDEALWLSVSESSIQFADSAWGAEAAWKILASILAEMGIKTERDNRPLKLYSSKG